MITEYGIVEFELLPVDRVRTVFRFDEWNQIDDDEPWMTDGESGIAIRMIGSLGFYWCDLTEWDMVLRDELAKVDLQDWYEKGRRGLNFSGVHVVVEGEYRIDVDKRATTIAYRILGLVDYNYWLNDKAKQLRGEQGEQHEQQ